MIIKKTLKPIWKKYFFNIMNEKWILYNKTGSEQCYFNGSKKKLFWNRVSTRVNGIKKNKSNGVICDKTETRESWKEYNKDVYGNDDNMSKGSVAINGINFSIQEKIEEQLEKAQIV